MKRNIHMGISMMGAYSSYKRNENKIIFDYISLMEKLDYKTIRLVYRYNSTGYWVEYDKNHIPVLYPDNIIFQNDNSENYRNQQIEKILC